MFSKASDAVLDQEISKYPIFAVHQGDLVLGIPLVDKDKMAGNWSINVSTLEEFVAKQIIETARLDNFKEVFKDPQHYLCLFVLSEAGANFVFLPRGAKDPARNN